MLFSEIQDAKEALQAQPADFPTKHPAGIQAHINRTMKVLESPATTN